jgi:hypothetical protein
MRLTPFAMVVLLVTALVCGCQPGLGPPAPQDDAKPQDKERAKVEGRQAADKAAGGDGKDEAPRKIIYTGAIDLIVEDFDKAEQELVRLVEDMKGYVGASETKGERGAPRSGRWTVRVPEPRFAELRSAVARLGEARRNSIDSDDVTENYYDLKERLKTFQVEEEGLRDLYKEKAPSSKLEELAVLRRELTQIRSHIEEMTGKLKRWDKQAELATVVVTMQDRKDYTPPIVPDFGGAVGRTFQGSVEALVGVAKWLVLAVVALAPWAAVAAVLGAPFWWRLWRKFRARTTTPPAPAVHPPPAPTE